MTGVAATDPVVASYAEAIFTVGQAEGASERVEDELFRFGRTIEGDTQLADRMADPSLGAGEKLGIVTDLLAGRAHPATVSAVAYVVQAGRARQLVAIADALVAISSASRSSTVAEVRTAAELSDDQQRRLADAVGQAVGGQVELRIIHDPQVVGGLVVKVGDTVIDGSVARRLTDLRTALTSSS